MTNMKFIQSENKLLNVCVIDTDSRLYNAPNSVELIQEVKHQIETLIEEKKNCGINGILKEASYNLSDIFFTYDNPRIIDKKLYVDLKILNVPIGVTFMDIVKNHSEEYMPVKFGVSLVANVNEDNSIINPKLICINFIDFYIGCKTPKNNLL